MNNPVTFDQAQAMALERRRNLGRVCPWGWGDDDYFLIRQHCGDDYETGNYEYGTVYIDRESGMVLPSDAIVVLQDLLKRDLQPFGDFTTAPKWERNDLEDWVDRHYFPDTITDY